MHAFVKIIVLLCLSAFLNSGLAQDIPTEFWPSRHLEVLHDFGHYWEMNSIFKPYRWERLWPKVQNDGVAPNAALGWVVADLVTETEASGLLVPFARDTLNLRWWNGLLAQQPAGNGRPFSDFSGSPYINLNAWFRQKLNVQLYLRATNEPASLPHFTGRPREISRLGLNALEVDLAAISYANNWLTVQFGRGRQIWGGMESNNLAISANSPAYEHLMLEAQYKKFRGRFFYGFLESTMEDGQNINRYLVGHGIEYSNHRNLLLGLTEINIFSGVDRPLDPAFLNPFVPALEVEQNRRTNKQRGSASSNAVWTLSVDWMPFHGVRFSGNYTIDEFQFDNQDREIGRPDAVAYQFRLAYSTTFGALGVTGLFDYARVGTFTFSHFVGSNNFVSREQPLGADIGSDSDRWQAGLRFLLPQRVILSARLGVLRSGERDILIEPYREFSSETFRTGPFPSGLVQKTNFFDWEVRYSPLRNIDIAASGRFSSSSGRFDEHQGYVVFAVNAYLPWWVGL